MRIINARIYTMDGFVIQNGYIEINGGVIEKTAEMNENIKGDFDACGAVAVPGFTDAHTHLGMDVSALCASPVNYDYYAADYANFSDRYFDLALKSGVTAVGISPVSQSVVGGKISAVSTVTKKIIKKDAALKLSVGSNPKKAFSLSDDEIFKIVSQVKTEIPMHIHAHAQCDIVKLPKNAMLVHGTDTRGKVKILAGPMLTDISKKEMENLSYKNLYEQYKSGAQIALISDHPETPVNYLLLYAQLAAKNGVASDGALEMITINPAKMLGIDNEYGKIKEGYKSGVLLFDRHPIDFYSKLIKIFV